MHLSILWNRHFQLLKSPADFAAATNEDLVKIFGSVVTFATAMSGIIDASAGTLCFAGVGGPTPLIIHENWVVEEPKSTDPPLGIMEDIPYQEKTVKLESGDSILLFSDGATEIQNAQNEWLGVEGFTQILKSLDYPKVSLSMQTLEEKLLMFSNDIRLKDDVTVIEARYFG
jgi:serine phosphatase RsbU (regulator of sigma subunit)